jgi:EmrB/QacA subfamily drug resistance transporter
MGTPARCDEPMAARGRGGASARHPVATIAATILGSSLAFIDGSVVNVALPTIGHAFHAGPAALAWTINAYLLPLGALILLGGAIGDHYGRRRVFQLGIAIFLLASLLCTFAPTLALLLAGRGLQGIGSALLMPSSLAILGASFSGRARGRAIGTWAAAGAIAGAVGPLLGGWIVDAFGWRLIFLINLPIGVGAAWLACYADESRDRREASRLDWTGGLVATVGLGVIVWALSAAAEPSAMRVVLWAAGAAGAALLAVFVWIESRKGDAALMPPALFATSSFIGLSLLTFFLYAALGGLIVLLPFLLIRLGHYSAIEAGAAMLPIPLLIGLGSRAMGGVAAKWGGRLLLSGGSLIVAAGLALYVRIDAGATGYWRDILPSTLLIAIGMAICVAPLTTSVMESVDADHVGAASGFNSALARIGGLLATALLGFVFAAAGDDAALVTRIHYAAITGAACCVLAAACAYGLIPPSRKA